MQKPEGVVPSVSMKLLKSQARKARKRYYKPINYIDSQGIVQRKETQHKYSTAAFKISNRKLKMLADQIGSGKPLDFAILQMQFSKKRAAKRIKSTLALAKDHAIAKGLDGKKLVVAEAWVNKHRTLKRLEIKGRGRAGVRKHKYCRLHIILREGLLQSEKDEKKLKEVRRQAYSIGTGGVSPTNAPLRNQWKSPGWQW
ncbi:ribosomal protein L22 [Ceraceosorus guamensis]|uniref:Ribosomal protein L22 n=1 Tax=Ceraceosorus guamensis TaxID=1522189 RepID=A0A316W6W8_9BASI|nr:ribosomal protein L22 [Ceraceosorus guamensis]PWN44868.1 ribosomal protein L22 [Ceraceosorus guamensis]